MKNEFIALIILFLLVSCQSRQQVTENISTIDSILQVNVTSLLENKLSELDALSGQAIVMEVQSGQIKALVGLTRKDSTNVYHGNRHGKTLRSRYGHWRN